MSQEMLVTKNLMDYIKEGQALDAKIIENQKAIILIQEQLMEAQRQTIISLKRALELK